MTVRLHVAMDPEMQRRAFARAAELGILFEEYMRRLVARDLGEREPRGLAEPPQEEVARRLEEPRPKADLSIFFDLIDAQDGATAPAQAQVSRFVDSSAWFASAVARDRYNARAKTVLREAGQLVTTDHVHFAVYRYGHDRERAFEIVR